MRPQPPAPQRDTAPSTAQLIAENAARDAAELAAFAKTLADHFGCPEMLDPRYRGRLRSAFVELRKFASDRRAETSRRQADPTAPRRGPGGKFLPRGR